jgi:hypothetical protein
MSVGSPVITDVAVRLSDGGDMVRIDFECNDGRTRTVALPVAVLPKLVGGMMAAGAEAAARRPTPPLSLAERELLHDGARTATDWRVTPAPGGRDVMLELEAGAALVCLRVPALAARLVGLALQGAAGDLH